MNNKSLFIKLNLLLLTKEQLLKGNTPKDNIDNNIANTPNNLLLMLLNIA